MDGIGKLLTLIHAFGELMTAVAVFGGIVLGLWSLFLMWDWSRGAGQSSQRNHAAKLAMTVFAAALLLKIGATVNDVQSSVFVSSGSYPGGGSGPAMWRSTDQFDSQNAAALQARLIVDFFAVVGFAGIIKAIMMMPSLAHNPNARGGEFKKFLAFFLGGTFMLRPVEVAAALGEYFKFISPIASFLQQSV
ncbi:MAG: hypothetical protein CVV05_00725 [Gammaproteobacteria bacterium HGW-Gammaproteobacteria-1]|jgi:hypothetical protein|nr:MAG: hypothetical protein CVV05_00725 [Gammaproteobacteria bacterium HGW-Gammaproteobacteria-1]